MPKQLNNGQITQALQRAFGFKGRYIPMLDEVIVPVYNIADPSPAQVTRLVAGTLTETADDDPALQQILVQVRNPAGSGVTLNVTDFVVQSNIKQTVHIAFFDGGASIIPDSVFFRDRRNSGLPAALMARTQNQVSSVGDVVAQVEVDGTLSQTASWETAASDPRQPLAVLSPGRGLIAQFTVFGATGDTLTVNFRGLEIPITETNPDGGIP